MEKECPNLKQLEDSPVLWSGVSLLEELFEHEEICFDADRASDLVILNLLLLAFMKLEVIFLKFHLLLNFYLISFHSSSIQSTAN